jgi:hypothetical protein
MELSLVPTPTHARGGPPIPGRHGTVPHDPIARRDRFIDDRLAELPETSVVVNVGCGVVRRFEPSAARRYLATDLRLVRSMWCSHWSSSNTCWSRPWCSASWPVSSDLVAP